MINRRKWESRSRGRICRLRSAAFLTGNRRPRISLVRTRECTRSTIYEEARGNFTRFPGRTVFQGSIDLNDLGSNDCLHDERTSLDAIRTIRRWNSRHPNALGHLVLEIVARVPGDANFAKTFFVFYIHLQGTEQRLRRVDTSNGEYPEHLPGSSVLRIFLYRSFLFFLFSLFFFFLLTRERRAIKPLPSA